MKRREFLGSAIVALLALPCAALAGDLAHIELHAAAPGYCPILRFPKEWQMPRFFAEADGSHFVPPKFGVYYDFESRD